MNSERSTDPSENDFMSVGHLYTMLLMGIKAAPGRVSDAVKVTYDLTYRSCTYVYAWEVELKPDPETWDQGIRSYRLFLSMDDTRERMGFREVTRFQREGRVKHVLESEREMAFIVTGNGNMDYEIKQKNKSTLGKLVDERGVRTTPRSRDVVAHGAQMREIARDTMGIFRAMPRKPLRSTNT